MSDNKESKPSLEHADTMSKQRIVWVALNQNQAGLSPRPATIALNSSSSTSLIMFESAALPLPRGGVLALVRALLLTAGVREEEAAALPSLAALLPPETAE